MAELFTVGTTDSPIVELSDNQVEGLARKLDQKLKIPYKVAKKVKFTYVMQEHARMTKQFVVVIKILEGKVEVANLRTGLEQAWVPCTSEEFGGVANHVELFQAKLQSQEQIEIIIESSLG